MSSCCITVQRPRDSIARGALSSPWTSRALFRWPGPRPRGRCSRVARAPNSTRIASLLATGQFDVALLPSLQAVALEQGRPPFASYEAMALRSLFASGDFLLVCRPDFPEEHAYLVTSILVHNSDQKIDSTFEFLIPLHPGSRAYLLDR